MKMLRACVAGALLAAWVAVPAAEPAGVDQPAAQLPDSRPAGRHPPAAKAAAKPPAVKQDAGPAATADSVALDTTQITGNRELPRVLYVVPWKRADLGDPGGKPAKSLLDEVLAPVDREVFQRQNRYHDALQPDAAAPQPAQGGGQTKVEK
ncbi:MAG TPA: hypothetical protein VMH77_02895 [Steroidobacteraceae bacterium]|nr:hypothetical protein [Steroidobacteraceae bacterium]